MSEKIFRPKKVLQDQKRMLAFILASVVVVGVALGHNAGSKHDLDKVEACSANNDSGTVAEFETFDENNNSPSDPWVLAHARDDDKSYTGNDKYKGIGSITCLAAGNKDYHITNHGIGLRDLVEK